MRAYLYFSIIYSAIFCANIHLAQAQYTEDFRAKAVLEKQYVDFKGTPYLNEDWSPGVVKLANGSTYTDMQLKFDQVSGDLIFKNKEGKVLSFADPVSEFKLSDKSNVSHLFRSGYKPSDANSGMPFYEVLYDGGSLLLKSPKKNIVEHRTYNSSTVVKSIVETPAYYLRVNGQLVKIKKDKKSVLSALGNPVQLDKYIGDNKLNLKEDGDLVKAMLFYDGIMPQ